MPKGYRKPADWDGFAMAVGDAMHDEQLAAVKRDNPRQPTYDELRAEVERLRAALQGIADNPDPLEGKCYCRWSSGVARQALSQS